MEAKKYITHKVTRHALETDSYSEEYSSMLVAHYTKIIILVALMMLSYRICISEDTGCIKLINKVVNIAIADTDINAADSNKIDSTEHFGPVIGGTNSVMDSSDALLADTLNFIARQNETIAASMVNSYFEGIDDADSIYKVNKSIKSGTFLFTIIASPLISVFPVAISSAIHPSMKHLHIDVSKLSNPAYMKGFKYQAHYIKKKKLWGCFVEGGTPWCMLMGFLML